MRSYLIRMIGRMASLDDAQKLCFGAAAAFGLVGGVAWLGHYLGSMSTQLTEFVWIGLFYLLLGKLERVKAARFTKGGVITKDAGVKAHAHEKEERKSIAA